jgi:hypothetical protein
MLYNWAYRRLSRLAKPEDQMIKCNMLGVGNDKVEFTSSLTDYRPR